MSAVKTWSELDVTDERWWGHTTSRYNRGVLSREPQSFLPDYTTFIFLSQEMDRNTLSLALCLISIKKYIKYSIVFILLNQKKKKIIIQPLVTSSPITELRRTWPLCWLIIKHTSLKHDSQYLAWKPQHSISSENITLLHTTCNCWVGPRLVVLSRERFRLQLKADTVVLSLFVDLLKESRQFRWNLLEIRQ